MEYEDAANIDEFAGKVLHNAGRSNPPTVLTLPTPVNSKTHIK